MNKKWKKRKKLEEKKKMKNAGPNISHQKQTINHKLRQHNTAGATKKRKVLRKGRKKKTCVDWNRVQRTSRRAPHHFLGQFSRHVWVCCLSRLRLYGSAYYVPFHFDPEKKLTQHQSTTTMKRRGISVQDHNSITNCFIYTRIRPRTHTDFLFSFSSKALTSFGLVECVLTVCTLWYERFFVLLFYATANKMNEHF